MKLVLATLYLVCLVQAIALPIAEALQSSLSGLPLSIALNPNTIVHVEDSVNSHYLPWISDIQPAGNYALYRVEISGQKSRQLSTILVLQHGKQSYLLFSSSTGYTHTVEPLDLLFFTPDGQWKLSMNEAGIISLPLKRVANGLGQWVSTVTLVYDSRQAMFTLK